MFTWFPVTILWRLNLVDLNSFFLKFSQNATLCVSKFSWNSTRSAWILNSLCLFLYFRRYQRLSPDCLPLPTGTTGRKSDLTPNLNPTPVSNSNPNANQGRVSPNSDAKSRGGRLTSDAPSTSTSANHGEISGGDLLLQWGHNKRTRGPRTGQAGDDSASSHMRSAKIQRRSSGSTTAAEKLMPPPQLPVGSYTRGANLRSAVSLPNHHR